MSSRPTPDAAGFTLIEVIVAMLITAFGLIAIAPMFIFAMRVNSIGGSFGTLGATAVQRMERLRAANYNSLNDGGDLESDVVGYFDESDPDFTVRWTIIDNPNPPANTKIIAVRAFAIREFTGPAEQFTLRAVRGL